MLRNAAALPASTGRTLAQGETFTRADVMAGRVVFEHEDGAEDRLLRSRRA